MMHLTLYKDVPTFYTQLTTALSQAQRSITMLYYTFDYGEIALQISHILETKQATGVTVRLMVDEVGLLLDAPTNALKNRWLMSQLTAAGVEVTLFRPRQRRTTRLNCLHCKLCAIDQRTAFIGGSNIGDAYLRMDDLNLRLDGVIGHAIDELYSYLLRPTPNQPWSSPDASGLSSLRLSNLQVGEIPLLLTLPGQRKDVRRALLSLILEARTALYIRTWLFLPDREILNALLHQSEQGCQVHILFSDRTRVPLIDAANTITAHQLVNAGIAVWRYTSRFMHAKAAWNDQGQVLFGSANLDNKALSSNYECSLLVHHPALAAQLRTKFDVDVAQSHAITTTSWPTQPWVRKVLAYTTWLLICSKRVAGMLGVTGLQSLYA